MHQSSRTLILENQMRRSHKFAQLIPPYIIRLAKYLLSEWKYVPDGWPAKHVGIRGWNDQSVADAQEKHWPKLFENVQGTGPLGVSHFPWRETRENRSDHNAMMSYGYVLALAARKKDRLKILDWGGGIGHYYLYSKALLPDVALEYHCHDLPNLCRLGVKLLPDVRFHESSTGPFGEQYDLVISSSSLHYFEKWQEVVRDLAALTAEYLYIARLQCVKNLPSFVVVQKPHSHGYQTEYLSWLINRGELVSCIEKSGLELRREFIYDEDWIIRKAPEKGECRGFLFRRV